MERSGKGQARPVANCIVTNDGYEERTLNLDSPSYGAYTVVGAHALTDTH